MIKTTTLRVVSVVGLASMLAGCGVFFGDDAYFRNREGDYQKADKIPPLKVPEGMSEQELGMRYPIPAIQESEFEESYSDDEPEVPRPQPLATNLMQENVKIQRLGEERWILMNVSPGEVWPRVRSFLNENNVDVATADIGRGIIDSHWLQFKSDLNNTDRYRVQIDQGVQPETSEIHVLHQSVQGDAPSGDLRWPEQSTSEERESWLLDELAAALAADKTIGGTSLLARSIGGEAKSALVVESNEPVMKIKLNQRRARATLFHAMKQDGFSIYESEPEEGVYYLRYVPVKPESDGWFSGWFEKEPDLVAESPYTLEQLMSVVPEGDAFEQAPLSDRDAETQFPDAPGYLLFMDGEPGSYTIRLRDPYGKRLDASKVRKLLTLLRKNLI